MSTTLNIRFRKKVQKLQIRPKMQSQNLQLLLANLFGLKSSKIIGVKDKDGNVYDLELFIYQQDILKNQTFDLIVQEEGLENITQNNYLQTPPQKTNQPCNSNQKSLSQPQSGLYNQTPQKIFLKNLHFVQDYLCFEKINIKKDNISVLFIFDSFNSAQSELRIYLDIIEEEDFQRKQGNFYYFVLEQSRGFQNLRAELIQEIPSVLIFAQGIKMLEFSMKSFQAKQYLQTILTRVMSKFHGSYPSQENNCNLQTQEIESIYDIEKSSIQEYSSYYLQDTESARDRQEFLGNSSSKATLKVLLQNWLNEFIQDQKLTSSQSKNFLEILNYSDSECLNKIEELLINNDKISVLNLVLKETSSGNQSFDIANMFKKKSKSYSMNFQMSEGDLQAQGDQIKILHNYQFNQTQQEFTQSSQEEQQGISIQIDFEEFLNKNKDFFALEEFGMAKSLYKQNFQDLKDILRESQKIPNEPLILSLIKSLASTQLLKWYLMNFNSEEFEFISLNKNSKNSSLHKAFLDFSSQADLNCFKESLVKVIKRDFYKRRSSILSDKIHEQLKSSSIDSITQSKKQSILESYVHKQQQISVVQEESSPYSGESSQLKNRTSHGPINDNFLRLSSGSPLLLSKYSDLARLRTYNNKKLINLDLQSDQIKEKNHERGDSMQQSTDRKDRQFNLMRKIVMGYFNQNDIEEVYMIEFQKLKQEAGIFFTEVELNRLQYLFDHMDSQLLHILSNYEENILVDPQSDLSQNLLALVQTSPIIKISNSPVGKKRVKKYNIFQNVLLDILDDKKINSIQFKIFLYLFAKDEISLLSSFEVFELTKDQDEFIENLQLVYKIHFFKFEEEIDDISDFDDLVQRSFKILYAFRHYLNQKELQVLEKIIKTRDTTIVSFHNQYLHHRKKASFINNLKQFSQEKDKHLQELEKLRQLNASQNLEIKFWEDVDGEIKILFGQKVLKNVQNLRILQELQNNKDSKLRSVFQVFKINKDRQDFAENLILLYKYAYKKEIKQIVAKFAKEENWTESQVDNIKKSIDEENKMIFGSYELYMATQDQDDEDELKDTLKFFK